VTYVNVTMDNCYSLGSILINLLFTICVYFFLRIFVYIYVQSLKNKKKKGQGWSVSSRVCIGPGSGSIFLAHIQTGLFSPALKSPLPGRAGPKRAELPVSTSLVVQHQTKVKGFLHKKNKKRLNYLFGPLTI